MSTALVTGITGQDGWYLSRLLLARGYRVVGVARHPPRETLPAAAEFAAADVGDQASITRLVARIRPDEVYHLAGESSVARSWDDPRAAAAAEEGAGALLLAVRDEAPAARVLLASSSEVFGAASTSPQDERTPIRPVTPYGRGKAAVLAAGQTARVTWGLHASSAILYNHESPRRPPAFVSRKVTMAVAAIAAGRASEVRLGNLRAVRDWGFAGDHVDAMWRIVQAEAPDDYVIGTGVGRTVEELCATAFASVGLEWADHVVSDPALFRPVDPAVLVADAARARRELGWVPRTSFADMITAMVEADAARLRRGEA